MSDKFEWTDRLVAEFMQKMDAKYGNSAYFILDEAEEFKKEKTHKEWEIMRVRNKYHNTHITHNLVEIDGRKYINDQNYDYVLNCLEHKYTIEAVRRLSDGEVFSVGDEVEYVLRSSKRYIANIESFEISGSYMYAHGNPNSFCISLGDVSKVIKPKPLFVTEDGVELFDGAARLFGVLSRDTWQLSDCYVTNAVRSKSIGPTDWKFFSSHQKRQEYILMNKPLISLNEILSAWDGVTDGTQYSDAPLFLKMKWVAKQKLRK